MNMDTENGLMHHMLNEEMILVKWIISVTPTNVRAKYNKSCVHELVTDTDC